MKPKPLALLCVALILLILGGKALRVALRGPGSGLLRQTRALIKQKVGRSGEIQTVSAAAAEPQNVPERPVLRYHPVVQPKRLDAWKIIGPGGGGTFYLPVVSPHDPKLVFTMTDMTGCFVSEDGGATWREFNLRAPCAIVFDPKLPNRVYARAGPVWRSDDRGHTWSLLYPAPETMSGIIYVDDEAEPYMKSLTGYPAWAQAFAVDPDDSNTLYLVYSSELHVSNDGGKTWRSLAKGVGGSAIFIDPRSPRGNRAVWTVGGNNVALWDGSKLVPALKDNPSGTYFNGSAFGVAPNGEPVMYTVADFFLPGGVPKGGGVEATHDGGLTWSSLNGGIIKLVAPGTFPEFSAIGTSFFHPEVVYASVYHLHLPNDTHTYYGMIKTSDGGATWTVVRKEEGEVAPNMRDSWMSQRFGPDFADQPLGIAVAPRNPDVAYTTDLGRVMRSTDGGKTWDGVYSQGTDQGYTTTGLDPTTCYGVHFDPFDKKRMFITYTDIGLFRSEDGGKSWVSSTGHGVPRAWWNTTYWVEFDPAVRGRMWAAMSKNHDLPRIRMFNSAGRTASFVGGVVASDDGGKSWKVSSTGLPAMAATHILLDPRSPVDARVLYVTGFGRGVFKSADGGKTWTAKNKGLPEGEPLTWRMAMDRNGVLYVVTVRRSQNGKAGTPYDGWVFRSRDGAESWERVPLPPDVNGPVGITIDPQDPQRLYVSAWARYTLYAAGAPAPDGGVFLSTDGGKTWKNILDASRRIYDVTIDSENPNIVYAVGFEAAAWRSADRGHTWSRIGGYNFKNGHRVVVDPNDHSRIYITTFGSSVWYGPATGDPDAQEDIIGPPQMTFRGQNNLRLK